MGLDGVELVMEVEGEFGIRISDEAAGQIATVGQLADLVWSEVRGRRAAFHGEHCPTSRSFYAIRRRLCDVLPAQRRSIRPASRLREFIPRQIRRRVWAELTRQGFALPGLARPGWAVGVAVGGAIAPACALALGFRAPALLLTAALFGGAAALLTRPLAVRLPCSTVGELAMFAGTAPQARAWPSRAEVVCKLRAITAEQLGLPIESVQETSRFVEDLKLDQ